jgi:GAF domain-containing protein
VLPLINAPGEMRPYRRLLQRAQETLSSSATLLDREGKATAALAARRWARRIGIYLDHPDNVVPIHDLGHVSERNGLLERALGDAIDLLDADFGNIQLYDDAGLLRIVEHRGFDDEFLDYFAVVDDSAAACGRAAQQRSQVVIADVARDPGFRPHLRIATRSGFRAVQSTPIIDARGGLHGIISTHFRHAHRPSELELETLDWYAEVLGTLLAVASSPDGS